MAAPLYSENEIAGLMDMKKRILSEAWKPLHDSQKKSAGRRENRHEKVAQMKAEPFDPAPGHEFEIDICHNVRNDDISVSLWARMLPRPLVQICRYDVHDNPHPNPAWHPPPMIGSGEFHRHIYSIRAIREGDLHSWDAGASLLAIQAGGASPSVQLERLKRKFIDDLHLFFDDRAVEKLFVGFGK